MIWFLKMTLKNSQAMPNIVNGLISQLTTVVTMSPFLRAPTRLSDAKSICSIMGKIISQISTATGIDICAYENLESVVATPGQVFPMSVPAPMHSATQSVR